jgi:glycosyltransferase involved in cell wall biosynthesis
MNLGIFLHRGGSLENWKTVGQDKRVINYYLKKYAEEFDNVYFFSYADNSEKRKDMPENVTIIPNGFRIPFSLYALLMPLIHRKVIRKCDVFRVFHISGTIPAIISKLVFKKPYVTTYGYLWLRDILFHGKYLDYFVAKPVEWLGLRIADRIIITLEKTRKYVMRFVKSCKIAYIPNGVDTNLFKRISGRNKTGKIISIGRLVRIKNYESLIKAVSKISNSELLLFGDGPERKNLGKLAKISGCKLVLKGMIPNEKLPDEINKADVFVLPSHSEGMPKALLEVMACEIPCIVSDLPTLKEIIRDGENGFVCNKNPESILEKIEYVLNHPKEAEEMAGRARKKIVSGYSIDKLVSKEIKLLKELVR